MNFDMDSEPIDVNGFKMYVDPTDALDLKKNQIFEKFETELVTQHISNGDTILDIGANIGYFTLLFSKLVGETGIVHAFEPDPNNFSILKKNIEINNIKNVVLNQKAISDVSKKISFYLCDYNHAQHRIYPSSRCTEEIQVDAITIDEYFDSDSISGKINFIKMDVEGSEFEAIHGMKNTLKSNPQLKFLCEFSPKQIIEHKLKPENIIQQLLDSNFKILPITTAREQIIDIDYSKSVIQEIMNIGHGLNLFCIPKN
jgi:FkbM family methyltransferase